MGYNTHVVVTRLARDSAENDVMIAQGWIMDPYMEYSESLADTAAVGALRNVASGQGISVHTQQGGGVTATSFIGPAILEACIVSVSVRRDN